ncbi:MAG: tRNA dihydrouridine synthase DusB [Mollicutes bacterium]|nr:tRNA dihydrouridine synthase DusB [Mollicutes bacterium]
MWQIGNIKIKNRVVLAPMAGISNPSFIKIVEEMGLGLAFTELLSAEGIVRSNKKTLEMLKGIENLKVPIGIQIFGSNPETMAKAAQIITSTYQNAFIDINMGCPVPKVAVRSQAGSALLKNPKKIYEMVKQVVDSVSVPVTVKIRSGWDEKSINAPVVAKQIENAGASAITIHARTRSQGYSGKADWQIIKEVKEAINIPVIGNGDIKSCYDVKSIIDETGCDAVMIGRGVLGNPWLIKECIEYLNDDKKPIEITPKEKIQMLKKHYKLLQENQSERQAIFEIRSHALWYIKGLPNNAKIKNLICTAKSSLELFNILDDYLTSL